MVGFNDMLGLEMVSMPKCNYCYPRATCPCSLYIYPYLRNDFSIIDIDIISLIILRPNGS